MSGEIVCYDISILIAIQRISSIYGLRGDATTQHLQMLYQLHFGSNAKSNSQLFWR